MEEEPERSEIREELAKMTFEDLQKLKEKLGSKVYNEAMFGTKKTVQKDFKRANKNRPRELSSKRPEPVIVKKNNKVQVRDPRFDSLCGEFDDRKFRKAYSFLDKIRKKEKLQLIRQLKTEENPEERKRIKIVLQRLKNKEREELKKVQKEEKALAEKEEKIKLLKEGKKPHFATKLEKKVAGLVEQFSELKKTGKLKKHIEKQRKKLSQKERKRGVFDEINSD